MDVIVKGEKGEEQLAQVMVDTGATYTFLDQGILDRIGASRLPGDFEIELGDGKIIRARMYGIFMKYKEWHGPAIVASFAGSKNVIGVEALESLGLRLDPSTGKIESIRPPGLAYFYRGT